MATTFTPDVGYRGVVMLNDVIMLATSGQFSQAHQFIPSSGVWGAGYWNAAEVVAYANDIIRIEGSFGCELTAGQVFDSVKLFAFTNRGSTSGTSIKIFPNGEKGFSGVGWCSQLSFSCGQNQILTSEMSFQSYLDGVNNTITTGSTTNSKTGASNGELPMAYNGLYPYWMTELYSDDSLANAIADVIDWQTSYSSSLEMLKCCGMQGTPYADSNNQPLAPDYIGIGPMSADASLTVFKLQGDFAPESFHSQKALYITIDSPAGETGSGEEHSDAWHKICLPIVVCNQNSSQIQTGAGWVTASFSYTAIGDGAKPPMGLDSDEDESNSN